MELTFWYDPGCPWCWITSRWINEVSARRDLSVAWRSFSLKVKNAGNDLPEWLVRNIEATHGALRVSEAMRAAYGEERVAPLYTELGRRIHHDGDAELKSLPDALEAVGVAAALAERATDDSLDEPILASMDDAFRAAGEDVGTPIIRIGPEGHPGFFGPVLSPAPTGDAALALFDGLVAVADAGADGFFELKRERRVGPIFGPRS